LKKILVSHGTQTSGLPFLAPKLKVLKKYENSFQGRSYVTKI